jgi:hypothetical protein
MKITVAVLCALLFCAISLAQDKTLPPQSEAPKKAPTAQSKTDTNKPTAADKAIDPAKEKDLRQLLDLLGTRALVEQAVAELNQNVRPMLENSLPEGEYRDKLIDAFFVKLKSKFDPQQVLDMAVPIYDRQFSHEDVKGLMEFYQTPLGQKAIKALPQITAEIAEQSKKLGDQLGRQSMMEVLAEHPEFEKAMEEAQKPARP